MNSNQMQVNRQILEGQKKIKQIANSFRKFYICFGFYMEFSPFCVITFKYEVTLKQITTY